MANKFPQVPIQTEACWRIYGQVVQSSHPFRLPMQPASGSPNLYIQYVDQPPSPLHNLNAVPSYQASGAGGVQYYQSQGLDLLRLRDLADYFITSDRISVLAAPQADPALVEVHLLGTVMAFWLERRGTLALHCAAVRMGEKAVGFLASNRGGKTSLAITLMQAGFPLISDDIVAVDKVDDEFIAYPSYPSMRMWPADAPGLFGKEINLTPVYARAEKGFSRVGENGIGSFSSEVGRLSHLYLPERRTDQATIEILPLSPRQALIALLNHAFTPRLVAAAGLQPARLELLSTLVNTIPVYRLTYPSGHQYLPMVRDRLLQAQ